MKHLHILLFLLISPLGFAQEITLTKGVVMDSLSVSDTIAETYALYLPTTFTTDRSWPVLFVFDPEGRGRSAAQLIRQAAEEQGYIIVASNDIDKDESLLTNTQVGTRLMNRVFTLLPIDGNGIYTVGFSQGGMVATVLPAIFKSIRGVLPIGDLWVNQDKISQNENFILVGMAGFRDYRARIMEETAQMLSRGKVHSELYQFEGGHEWPSFDMLQNAIGSLTIHAMQKGYRPPDMVLVENLYQAELQSAERLRRSMRYFKAHQLLEKMQIKYAAYGKRDELRAAIRELGRTSIYRNQRREYNNAVSQELELRDRYIYFFNEDVSSAHFENLGWWNAQAEELRAMQQKNNIAEVEMAHRLEGMLKAIAHSTFTTLSENNANIDSKVFTAILQTIFDKENPEGYKNIISLSGQDGDYYTALLYLEDLLKTGYDDMEALYEISNILDLKLSPEYNELIRQYLGRSKYYNN